MEHHKKRLRTFVHVRRGDDPNAEYVAFGPCDDLPQWAIDQLADNPRVWRSDDDEPDDPQPAAPSLIGHEFESGSLVSGPMTTTSGQPPSSPSPGGSRRGPSGSPGPEAARGLAEAERRYGGTPRDLLERHVYEDTVDHDVIRDNLVPDAHIAALMRQHGVGTIWTANRDFRR